MLCISLACRCSKPCKAEALQAAAFFEFVPARFTGSKLLRLSLEQGQEQCLPTGATERPDVRAIMSGLDVSARGAAREREPIGKRRGGDQQGRPFSSCAPRAFALARVGVMRSDRLRAAQHRLRMAIT
jgi:hypothetical protein